MSNNITASLSGMKELQKALSEATGIKESVKTVVHHSGDALNRRMKRQTTTAFVKGYTTGQTAGTINTRITDGGMTAIVKPKTDYAVYVEYGTRYMAAEPFVKPAFEYMQKKFIEDLRKLVKSKL